MISSVSLSSKLYFKYKTFEHKLNQYWNNTGETVVADTEYGKIKGAKRKSLYDKEYYSFERIPYAEPPIGNLRFKAPQPPKPWDDILDCTKMNPKPMQTNLITGCKEGTEDCLYLNVYTNDLKPEKPRAVMVWIYGGAFVVGEASRDLYGPDLLMSKNIILVTLNYRLNVFGFLSLKDPKLEVPGNAGLKDQILALKWVKKNCSRFGGDPNNITVFGESAGGASTHFLCLTEQTKDLFQKAIIMSGNVLSPWGTVKPNNYAYRLAKNCGFTGEDCDKNVLEFLRNVKTDDLLVDDSKLLTLQERRCDIHYCFAPTVEPYASEDCVLPKEPVEMMETPWSNSIPIITGFTSREGLLFHPVVSKNPKILNELETCASLVPGDLVSLRDRESEECKRLGMKLKEAHIPKDLPPKLDDLLEILAFKHFIHPTHRFLLCRAKNSQEPTYFYRYDFESDKLFLPHRLLRDKNIHGVGHGDELPYLFHSITGRKVDKNSRDYKTIERMTSLFSQFAIANDPNCDAIQSVKWEPLEKDKTIHKCLNISDEVTIIDLPEMNKVKVWDSLYLKQKP